MNIDEIKTLEIGLINKCTLSCPLCLRNDKKLMSNLKKNESLEWGTLKRFLDELVKLERVVLMGAVSEPTLYPEFFELIEYLKGRNLKVRLCTSGSTHNVEWWKKLGPLLDENDIVRFPVDGSTQELHAKYRRGSILKDVLKYHTAFKSNSESTTILQHIIFQYNEHDKDNIRDIYFKENFDLLEMSPCYEPNLSMKNVERDGIIPIKTLFNYQRLKNSAADNNPKIWKGCPEARDNAAYLSHRGLLVPCNEQEDSHFKLKEFVNIYDNTTDEVIEYLNVILDGIKTDPTCLRACTEMGQRECFIFPITQYNKVGDKYELIDFRECMKR